MDTFVTLWVSRQAQHMLRKHVSCRARSIENSRRFDCYFWLSLRLFMWSRHARNDRFGVQQTCTGRTLWSSAKSVRHLLGLWIGFPCRKDLVVLKTWHTWYYINIIEVHQYTNFLSLPPTKNCKICTSDP